MVDTDELIGGEGVDRYGSETKKSSPLDAAVKSLASFNDKYQQTRAKLIEHSDPELRRAYKTVDQFLEKGLPKILENAKKIQEAVNSGKKDVPVLYRQGLTLLQDELRGLIKMSIAHEGNDLVADASRKLDELLRIADEKITIVLEKTTVRQ